MSDNRPTTGPGDGSRQVRRRHLLAAGAAAGALPLVWATGARAVSLHPMPDPTDPPRPTEETFTNPVIDQNFPDPGVLLHQGVYYAYVTNGLLGHVPVASSTDLVTWEITGNVLPVLGSWAVSGQTWAPEVLRVADDRFVLYYSARYAGTDPGRHAIGTAVADNPLGPFTDDSDTPLLYQIEEGGAIDASPFRDADGTLYLHWKNDGNAIGEPTHLYAQRLSPDGMRLVGERVRLLTNDPNSWHHGIIEAPQMHLHDGRYYLFYSGGEFWNQTYGVGYAVCDSPLGPTRDADENPILSSVDGADGPGHCSVIPVWSAISPTWMVYHARTSPDAGARTMWIDPVHWVDGRPTVAGPTTGPQPRPDSGM